MVKIGSRFTIEKRQLKDGLKYILREKKYSTLSAPDSVHDRSVHSSFSQGEAARAVELSEYMNFRSGSQIACLAGSCHTS